MKMMNEWMAGRQMTSKLVLLMTGKATGGRGNDETSCLMVWLMVVLR